jgi:hypothetical protein
LTNIPLIPQDKGMTPGLPSQKLTADQIGRLEKFRRAKRLSLATMNRTMASPFRWQTLSRALEGKAVWIFNHDYIVAWIDRYAPADPTAAPARDFKREAAGDRDEPNGETAPPARLRSEKEGEE